MTDVLALFTSREDYEEVPLRDRKGDLYGLHTKEESKKAEFVADVIAMANTARRYNATAYLLLGIDDKTTNICGLEEWLRPYGYPEEPLIKVWEGVRRRFTDEISNYVEPYIECPLIHGEIDGKQVACLEIAPQATHRPFRLKKQLKNKKGHVLSVDSCWIRRGESKSLIQIRDLAPGDPDWHSYHDRPNLLPTKWRHYFERILSLPEMMDAARIPGYQELSVGIQNESLQDCLANFLESTQNRLLVISGDAGCGKTSFIERAAYVLADQGLETVRSMIDREEFGSPQSWIPLYHSLRGTGRSYRTETELRSALLYSCNHMGQFWNETPKYPEWLFESPDHSWLLFLDGLDEIWNDEGQREFIDSLRIFLERFLRVKVVLTTRPHAILPDSILGLSRLVNVAPLSETEIRACLTTVTAAEIVNSALNTLQSHPDLWNLCSRPSYLAAAMRELGGIDEPSPRDRATIRNAFDLETGLRDIEEKLHADHASSAEPPQPVTIEEFVLSDTLTTETVDTPVIENRDYILAASPGKVIDHIYRYLWDRETTRRGIQNLKANEWKEQAGDLALATDGTQLVFRRQTMRKFLPEIEAEFWLMSLGILRQSPENHFLFCFFTELTKLYFAAILLSSYIAAGEIKLLQERCAGCQDHFRNQLRTMLVDLENQDISSIMDQ